MRIVQLCHVRGLAVHSFQQLVGILHCQWLAAFMQESLLVVLCCCAKQVGSILVTLHLHL